MKYICSTNKSHLFDNPTEDMFCPKCNIYEGVLIAIEESELEDYLSIIDSKQKNNAHKVEKKSKWICSTDSNHVFNMPTKDFFCPDCLPYEGVLFEIDEGDLKSYRKKVNNSTHIAEKRIIWVCSDDKHVFLKPTNDLFCDKCEPYTSVLMEYEMKK